VSSLLLLLQPAAALLLAAAVLGERPSLIQLGGAGLVCGGVLAASRPVSQTAAGAQPPEFYVKQLSFPQRLGFAGRLGLAGRKVDDGDPG
jgi:hypothetical protein